MDAFVVVGATNTDGDYIMREFLLRFSTASLARSDASPSLLTAGILFLFSSHIVHADDVRRSLAGAGVVFSVGYTGDVFGNPTGGQKTGTHNAGLAEASVEIDFEKISNARGLTFFASGYQIHGTSISGENVGGIAAVSNVEAYRSTRLFEAWIEQSLVNDAVSIRVGQIAADAEFFVVEGGSNFINSTFGWTTITSDNIPVGGPIYPIATPGIRVAVEPDSGLKLMAGLWNGDPVGPCPEDRDPGQCNKYGLDFRLSDAPLAIMEAEFNTVGGTIVGLPGTVKIGAWHHFGDFDDLRYNAFGGSLGATSSTPLKHEGNHGVYAVIDQTIYRVPGDDKRNITVFARAAASPSDRNVVNRYVEGGIVVTGPIASRPQDVFGIAVAYSGISDQAAAFDGDQGLSVSRSHEIVLEANYAAELIPGLTIQPDFQYFWNPGGRVPDDLGNNKLKDAAVFGLRTVVSY